MYGGVNRKAGWGLGTAPAAGAVEVEGPGPPTWRIASAKYSQTYLTLTPCLCPLEHHGAEKLRADPRPDV